MKTLILTAAISTMATFAAEAKDPISEVKEVGTRYDAALMAHDLETLKVIWDADGSFIGASGNVQNKKQMVEGMANLKIEKGFSTDKSYRIVGASVIEVGIYFAWGIEDGKPFSLAPSVQQRLD